MNDFQVKKGLRKQNVKVAPRIPCMGTWLLFEIALIGKEVNDPFNERFWFFSIFEKVPSSRLSATVRAKYWRFYDRIEDF